MNDQTDSANDADNRDTLSITDSTDQRVGYGPVRTSSIYAATAPNFATDGSRLTQKLRERRVSISDDTKNLRLLLW